MASRNSSRLTKFGLELGVYFDSERTRPGKQSHHGNLVFSASGTYFTAVGVSTKKPSADTFCAIFALWPRCRRPEVRKGSH